jgi:F0F1-type ATP synthase membrane subunit a
MDVPAIIRFTKLVFVPTLTTHILLAFALAFIPTRNTTLRSAVSAIIAAICMEAIRRCAKDTYEQASYADYMFGMAFHTNCYLVLLNLSPPQTATTPLQNSTGV